MGAMYHPEWHQGVVGILASRIKERFHRPVIAFAPEGDGILKASDRSVAGLHMRHALERLDTLNPGLMMKFGGHGMAAGLSLEEARFDEFRQRFGDLVGECEWLDPSMLEGVIWSDGELMMQELTLATAELLREGGPWGQTFPEPTFDGKFRILQQRLVGEKHLKLMVEPLGGGPVSRPADYPVGPLLRTGRVELPHPAPDRSVSPHIFNNSGTLIGFSTMTDNPAFSGLALTFPMLWGDDHTGG